jgi:hypothetical protein
MMASPPGTLVATLLSALLTSPVRVCACAYMQVVNGSHRNLSLLDVPDAQGAEHPAAGTPGLQGRVTSWGSAAVDQHAHMDPHSSHQHQHAVRVYATTHAQAHLK